MYEIVNISSEKQVWFITIINDNIRQITHLSLPCSKLLCHFLISDRCRWWEVIVAVSKLEVGIDR